MRKVFLVIFVATLMLVSTTSVFAYVAASSHYQLEKDSLNFGGLDQSSSANFNVNSTLGEIISGITNGSNYNASSGYRYMSLDPTASVTTTSGCKDPRANNYSGSWDVADNTKCTYGGDHHIYGCTDPNASNYDSSATDDNGSCLWIDHIYGCLDENALNYNPLADRDGHNCLYPPASHGCTDPRANNYIPTAITDDGSCRYSPFSTTTEEIITNATNWDFRFIQPQEPIKVFDSQMRVYLKGEKNLTIQYNYNLPPMTLKTIGITLTDPLDPTKTFSFLMHQSRDGLSYEATIGPLVRDGTYPIDIYVFRYDKQVVTHIKGKLIVSGTKPIIPAPIFPLVTLALILGYLPSLLDLFGLFFGRRKTENPWGTVYDSVTKRPLDPVYLIMEKADPNTSQRQEIATAISDIDGRFSFFLPAGTYYLKANKTHYHFPSTRLLGRDHDELYDRLYFGGAITANGEAVINLNVPLDPLDFDWNEFAKTKTDFFRFYTWRRLWANRLWRLLVVAGFLFSLYALWVSPSWWNLVMVSLYIVLFFVNRYWHERRKPRTVFNRQTGEPLPYAIVRLFLPDLNQQIKYAVADQYGRFELLVRPGVYYLTVEEKMPDGTYQTILKTEPLNLKTGILTENLYVK